MSKIRWGIISTALIGTEKVIPAMQKGEFSEVMAISSRGLEKAQASANRLGIPKAYGSYEELLADPDIDAVYNPLPNHLHVPWSIKALEAGKHVLCEKPISMDVEEAEFFLAETKKFPHLKVMEAFMYRHHPQWVKVKELVAGGAVGKLQTVHSVFTYYNMDPNNIRNMKDIGGGGLMDIGCYNLSLSRFIFEDEPVHVQSQINYDPNFGTDRLTSGMLQFKGGTATFTCSTQVSHDQTVKIYGTEGVLEIETPFTPPPDQRTRVFHERGGKIEEITFDAVDQYTIQGDLFSEAVLNDTAVPTPLEDAVENMRVIGAVFKNAR